MKNINYNPDVLDALANLSNDEVFTPPKLVNEILDMLPAEIWKDKNAKFLDPACKTGVFLREIAARLTKGLEKLIPDKQERINHIFTKQLFGIAITELTSLLSRRSVYCSKIANGKYSVCNNFKDEVGNIIFDKIEHLWENGRCKYCGASQEVYERSSALETHAYQLIHTNKPNNIFKNMKFDVIIGNPPYQLSVGNKTGNSSKAKAIYHDFITQSIKLAPRYLAMIIPSRWMTRSTEGIPSEWIDSMINDKRIKVLHDFSDAKYCFPGVEIKGGVCYFLWEKDYNGKCNYYLHKNESNVNNPYIDYLNSRNIGFVIRDIQAQAIIDKIERVEKSYIQDDKKNFSGLVSPKDFFTNKQSLTSSWTKFSNTKKSTHPIKYYLNKSFHKTPYGWIRISDISKNFKTAKLHKVYIPAAGGSGIDSQVLGYPFYGEPNSVCSQTYLVVGYDPRIHKFSKQQCNNIITYMSTRFFRYLVSIKKKTQNGPRTVYQLVPMQDFSQTWSDGKLYKKYKLSRLEIDFIESMIRPMDFSK